MKCLRGRGATFLFLRILFNIWYLITSWHEAQFVINKQLMWLETLLYTYLIRPKTKIDCQIKIPLFKIKISYVWIFNLGLPRDLKWTISSLLICKLLGPTNEPCLLVLYSEVDVQRSRQTMGWAQVYLRGHESSDGLSHELTAAIVRERETALNCSTESPTTEHQMWCPDMWGTRGIRVVLRKAREAFGGTGGGMELMVWTWTSSQGSRPERPSFLS